MIFGEPVEDHRRHGEVLVAEMFDARVQREQPVLPVDRAQDALALGHLQDAERRLAGDGLELQRLVARDDDGAGNRRQVARLAALLVVLDELVDLLADDLALIRLLIGGDAAFEQVPADLRLVRTAAHARRRALLPVVQHLEADEFVDVLGGQGSLIELHAKLLHFERGDADHWRNGPFRAPRHALEVFGVWPAIVCATGAQSQAYRHQGVRVMRRSGTFRSGYWTLGLALALGLLAVAITPAQQWVTETRDPKQTQDEDFAKSYAEWTGPSYYGSPLVDHLPKVPGIPTPKDVLGYHAGAPRKLTYYADLLKYLPGAGRCHAPGQGRDDRQVG